MKSLVPATLLLAASVPLFARASEYTTDIRPLLVEKCSSCHGAIRQEAGLRLDAGELIRRGGDSGKVLDLQSPHESLLLKRVKTEDVDYRMPPEGEGEPLSEQQIELLAAWIASGAPSPDEEEIPVGPDRHWAYQVPQRPPIPEAKDDRLPENPIDAFVFAVLEDAGIEPAPPADRRTLLRRVYFDLIGIPPSPEQQREFVSDSRADSWEYVVDQLLEDPAYGQRWGRHWMDVWRYSDWDGYKNDLRGSQRHIWRWREWIIESLNNDKPYDRMIVEMLAADEVAPADRDALRATGFLARNYHNRNRNIWLDATVEHTAKAFLAMTVNCARCHDHKYDPISQTEYYQLRAAFEPHNVRTERVPGQRDLMKDGLVRAFDANPDAETFLFIGGNEKHLDKDRPLKPAAPKVIGLPFQPKPVKLPPVAVLPALREFIEQEEIAATTAELTKAERQLHERTDGDDPSPLALELARQRVRVAEHQLASLKARWRADRAKFSADQQPQSGGGVARRAAKSERLAKVARAKLVVLQKRQQLGKAEKSTEDEAKKTAALNTARKELKAAEDAYAKATNGLADPNDTKYASVGKSYPKTSTGRRLALARWITHSRNPLTARVAVNHIWLRHFGEPLVSNVFDFGLRSPEPRHRKLLDWLAVELMEHDWSMKHVHRLILTSQTYRLSSAVDATHYARNRRVDPDNHLLWRANVRRLDAECVRDSVLHVAGNLDLSHGGPDIDFRLGEKSPRRSLYFRHAYEKQMRLLTTFDAASPTECYRRSQSIVPQQALALANSSLAIDQSRQLAGQLSQAFSDDGSFIEAAFEVVLSRECASEELEACADFLGAQTDLLARSEALARFAGKATAKTPPANDPAQRARENLVHVLMNHNDFVTIR